MIEFIAISLVVLVVGLSFFVSPMLFADTPVEKDDDEDREYEPEPRMPGNIFHGASSYEWEKYEERCKETGRRNSDIYFSNTFRKAVKHFKKDWYVGDIEVYGTGGMLHMINRKYPNIYMRVIMMSEQMTKRSLLDECRIYINKDHWCSFTIPDTFILNECMNRTRSKDMPTSLDYIDKFIGSLCAELQKSIKDIVITPQTLEGRMLVYDGDHYEFLNDDMIRNFDDRVMKLKTIADKSDPNHVKMSVTSYQPGYDEQIVFMLKMVKYELNKEEDRNITQ